MFGLLIDSVDRYLDNGLFGRGHRLTDLYRRNEPPLLEAVQKHPVETWMRCRLAEFHRYAAIDGNMQTRKGCGIERSSP